MKYYLTLLASSTSISTINSDDASLGTVTDGVKSIAEILSKYGNVVVILSVFLIVFILTILYVFVSNKTLMKNLIDEKNSLAETNKELAKANQEFMNNVLEKLNNYDGKNDHDPDCKETKDLITMYIDINIAFKDACRMVLNKLKCERVSVYIFHNGNKSTHGLPFFKTSCITEWTLRGSGTSRGKSHSELPLHILSGIVEELYNKGECFISDTSHQSLCDDSVFTFVEYSNIKSFFMYGIKDNDDNLVGFSVVEFKEIMDFNNTEIYNCTKSSIEIMNNSIKSIVIDNHSKYIK